MWRLGDSEEIHRWRWQDSCEAAGGPGATGLSHKQTESSPGLLYLERFMLLRDHKKKMKITGGGRGGGRNGEVSQDTRMYCKGTFKTGMRLAWKFG